MKAMRAFFVALWAITGAALAYSQPLAGCYERDTGVDRDFKLGEWLTLAFKSQNELEFNIDVVGPNGHLCTAHGIAMRQKSGKSPRFRFSRMAGEDGDLRYPNPACSLLIDVKPKEIAVVSEGECHAYFMCGARAYVDVQVPRSSRQPLGSHDCAMPMP